MVQINSALLLLLGRNEMRMIQTVLRLVPFIQQRFKNSKKKKKKLEIKRCELILFYCGFCYCFKFSA